jgi:hypothetical protein
VRLAPRVHAVLALLFATIALWAAIASDYSVAGVLLAIATIWGLYTGIQVRWNAAHGRPLWTTAYDPFTYRSGRDASGRWVTRRADDPDEPTLDGPVNPWPQQYARPQQGAGTGDVLPFQITGPPGHENEGWRRGQFLTRRDVERDLSRSGHRFGVVELEPSPRFTWLTPEQARRDWAARFSLDFVSDDSPSSAVSAPRFRALACDSPQGQLTLFEPAID